MTLVFSDTHLGKYDKKKDEFLKNLIKDYDNIIINGDFWDNWGSSYEDFINSKYKELFKLLKSKNTVYIYGNHDYRAEDQKELGEVFSNIQGIEFNIQIGKNKFHFEHGHRFFYNQKRIIFRNYYYIIDKLPWIIGNFVYKTIFLGYNLFPKRVGNNKIGQKRNDFIKKIKPKDIYYVTSHTHVPEIDESNKFINTGCIVEDFVTYVVIDDKGKPELIKKV